MTSSPQPAGAEPLTDAEIAQWRAGIYGQWHDLSRILATITHRDQQIAALRAQVERMREACELAIGSLPATYPSELEAKRRIQEAIRRAAAVMGEKL